MLLIVLPIASISFWISSFVRFRYVIFYLLNKNAICTWIRISRFVTIQREARQPTEATVKADDALTVVYHKKSGEGEVSLPPCKLVAVELGPSAYPNKAILQIMMNGSVETESKPITDIEKEKRYVKLTPTRYQTNIVLKTKKKGKVSITAYYST